MFPRVVVFETRMRSFEPRAPISANTRLGMKIWTGTEYFTGSSQQVFSRKLFTFFTRKERYGFLANAVEIVGNVNTGILIQNFHWIIQLWIGPVAHAPDRNKNNELTATCSLHPHMNMFYINHLAVCTVLRLGIGGKEEGRHCEWK